MDLKVTTDKYSSYEWGVLWMVISATALSTSFLFLKINLFYFNYFFTLFLRFLIPLIIVIILLTATLQWKAIFAFSRLPLQLLRSGCVMIAQYAIAFYITKSSLLNATVLLNASPLFIPLIEWLFWKQRPGKSTIVGALVAFLGVILVLQPDRSLFTVLSAVGLLGALGQAGSQVLYGLKPKSEHLLSTLFYLFFFTSLFSGGVWLLGMGKIEFFQEGVSQLNAGMGSGLLVMAMATLCNQYFRSLAYRCGRPSTLATFLYFSVFVSMVFDWLIFKEIPNALSLIGSCLIILGGLLKVFLRAHILRKKEKK